MNSNYSQHLLRSYNSSYVDSHPVNNKNRSSDQTQDAKKCFHGFKVGKVPVCTDILLGEGSYGKVYQGICNNGCTVAIKKIWSCNSQKNELEFLEKLAELGRHPNIIEYFGHYTEVGLRNHSLVFEMADCIFTTFFRQNLSKINYKHFNDICYQFMDMISFLKHNKINHNDMDDGGVCKNIMYSRESGKIKLIDFESATIDKNNNWIEFEKILSKLNRLKVEIEYDHSFMPNSGIRKHRSDSSDESLPDIRQLSGTTDDLKVDIKKAHSFNPDAGQKIRFPPIKSTDSDDQGPLKYLHHRESPLRTIARIDVTAQNLVGNFTETPLQPSKINTDFPGNAFLLPNFEHEQLRIDDSGSISTNSDSSGADVNYEERATNEPTSISENRTDDSRFPDKLLKPAWRILCFYPIPDTLKTGVYVESHSLCDNYKIHSQTAEPKSPEYILSLRHSLYPLQSLRDLDERVG